jgi:hypothetical protein
MLGKEILPGLLLVLATTASSVHPNVVEAAANECKAKPDAVAPAGSRWHYRVSRVDQSRCWFLSSQNVSVHSRLSQTAPADRSHVITPNVEELIKQPDGQIGPQKASAIEPAGERLASGQTIVPQIPPDPPRSDELLTHKVATIPYRLSAASTGALVQANPSGAQASTGVANFNLAFLGAALATSLSLAGGLFHVTRRVRLHGYALADRPNADKRTNTCCPEPVVDSLKEAEQQLCSVSQPTGWQPTGLNADHLNRSVREVRRNLERAGFARAA